MERFHGVRLSPGQSSSYVSATPGASRFGLRAKRGESRSHRHFRADLRGADCRFTSALVAFSESLRVRCELRSRDLDTRPARGNSVATVNFTSPSRILDARSMSFVGQKASSIREHSSKVKLSRIAARESRSRSLSLARARSSSGRQRQQATMRSGHFIRSWILIQAENV